MVCPDCGSDTFPGFGSHHCVSEDMHGVHTVMWKIWDSAWGAWRIESVKRSEPRPKAEPNSLTYFDINKVEWVTLSFGPEKSADEETYVISSCEIPTRQVKASEPVRSYAYTPVKPWEGIDRNKWPNTWQTLVFLYFQPDWWKGKYMVDEKYRDRIKGKHEPEKQETTGRVAGSNHQGKQYGDFD